MASRHHISKWCSTGLLIGLSLFAPLVLASPVVGQDDAKSDSTAAPSATTEATAVRQLRAVRINPHSPRLDGRLDDRSWQNAHFVSGFVQKQPNEGEPATDDTEIAFCYDDEALYIGARMHSTQPEKILATMSRRDNVSNSERILVSMDTYRDRRTAYTFGVTASGVRVDYYHGSDHEYSRDYDWDPIWQAKVRRTASGWTAEMRIPFGQLRFNKRDLQEWGVNVNRWVPTHNEDSYLVLVPQNDTGWSSRMGALTGIQYVKPSRRGQLIPYVASEAVYSSAVDPGDPFYDGSRQTLRFGGDVILGVGPNLTLEGTVNPDFGQVDADPAVVNLSAFETFFDERRPFFTEGSNLLSGGGANYFYSRRIGAAPHHHPDSTFVNSPPNTTILGAAKLTGRMSSGLNVGILGAVTAKETADAANADGLGQEVDVEPMTGFGVVRLQQEFGTNASTAGIILTGVERDLEGGSELDRLMRRRALAGGTDWNLRFSGGKYEVGGNVGFSYIEGSRSSITDAQESSARYFQRPDADYVEVDPNATSLAGWTSDLWFEKNSGKHWLGGFGIGAESPGFEVNDAGRLSTADDIDGWVWLRYRENDPGPLFQNWWIGLGGGSGWNFGRVRQYSYLDLESVWTFRNFSGSFVGFEYFPASLSDNLTRGGPLMGTGESWNVWAELWSSNQKKTTWNVWGGYSESELGSWSYNAGGGVTLRPGSRWQLSLNPRWNQRVESRQYVDTRARADGSQRTFGERYIFSFIERSELVVQTRLNFAFTPDLTLELYAEPFAASGRYYGFGELEAAQSKYLRTYGTDGTTINETEPGVYRVTDGSDSFDIDRSNFNVLSFRSNLVLRWEWSPGSTLFLVWQQNRSDSNARGSLVSPSNLLDAFNVEGDNFLALKITYWIPFL